MNKEEIEKVLEELHTVRPEVLTEEGRRIFESIMCIADERDLLQQRIDKAIELIERLIKEYKLNYGEELSKMIITYNTLLEILKGDSNE